MFVFNYRVYHREYGEGSLFPKPADDLAAAVKSILGHTEEFGLHNTEYVTAGYPPCYIVHAKDDPVVDCKNSKELYRLLKEQNIPAELELAEFGGHGWGDGSGSRAAGWP